VACPACGSLFLIATNDRFGHTGTDARNRTDSMAEFPEDSTAWQSVMETLDQYAPEWRAEAVAGLPAHLGDAACRAIKRMAWAAETDELSLLKTHLRNEMAVIRVVLDQPGLPLLVEKELRAHLMRMARLV
jgi:hypothetical protein